MKRNPYVYAPRVCVVCEGEYIPRGATQKYCMECRPLMRRKMFRDYKRKTRLTYTEAQFTGNDITETTDFLNVIRARIKDQRGDLVTVKKLVRHVLDKMKITSVSHHALKICYAATDKVIVDEFGGKPYGRSYYGGNTFRIRKERKT